MHPLRREIMLPVSYPVVVWQPQRRVRPAVWFFLLCAVAVVIL
jgi:hypothetical protein